MPHFSIDNNDRRTLVEATKSTLVLEEVTGYKEVKIGGKNVSKGREAQKHLRKRMKCIHIVMKQNTPREKVFPLNSYPSP